MPRKTLLFAAVLLLSGCQQKGIEIAVPPVERFAPVAEPQVPAGDTDAEVAQYLIDLITRLREANGKLSWLGDWREGVTD